MCIFKGIFPIKLQLPGDFVAQTPYRGSTPGPPGDNVPQTPSLCPPDKLSPL